MQQALQGPPAGVPFCSAYQALRWPSSLGPFSVFSCRCQGTPGEREATAMASLPARDSAVSPCLHGCRPLVHRGLPHVPSGHLPAVRSRQLPAAACSRGLASLSRVRRAVARSVCMVVTAFNHRSAVALASSLRCWLSVPDSCPVVGI